MRIWWLVAVVACDAGTPPPAPFAKPLPPPATVPVPAAPPIVPPPPFALGPIDATTKLTVRTSGGWLKGEGATAYELDGSGHLAYRYEDRPAVAAGSIDPKEATRIIQRFADAGVFRVGERPEWHCTGTAHDAGSTFVEIDQGDAHGRATLSNSCLGDGRLASMLSVTREVRTLFSSGIERFRSGPSLVIEADAKEKDVVHRIQATLKVPQLDNLRACYVTALAQHPKLAGTLVVTFVVESDGKVSRASASRWSEPTTPTCLEAVLAATTFSTFADPVHAQAKLTFAPTSTLPVPPGVTPPPPI